MVIDGSKFFTKILSVVDWSSLFLNFSQDLPGTVFEVSATALCGGGGCPKFHLSDLGKAIISNSLIVD